MQHEYIAYLHVLAPETPVPVYVAAALWQCDPDSALAVLLDLAAQGVVVWHERESIGADSFSVPALLASWLHEQLPPPAVHAAHMRVLAALMRRDLASRRPSEYFARHALSRHAVAAACVDATLALAVSALPGVADDTARTLAQEFWRREAAAQAHAARVELPRVTRRSGLLSLAQDMHQALNAAEEDVLDDAGAALSPPFGFLTRLVTVCRQADLRSMHPAVPELLARLHASIECWHRGDACMGVERGAWDLASAPVDDLTVLQDPDRDRVVFAVAAQQGLVAFFDGSERAWLTSMYVRAGPELHACPSSSKLAGTLPCVWACSDEEMTRIRLNGAHAHVVPHRATPRDCAAASLVTLFRSPVLQDVYALLALPGLGLLRAQHVDTGFAGPDIQAVVSTHGYARALVSRLIAVVPEPGVDRVWLVQARSMLRASTPTLLAHPVRLPGAATDSLASPHHLPVPKEVFDHADGLPLLVWDVMLSANSAGAPALLVTLAVGVLVYAIEARVTFAWPVFHPWSQFANAPSDMSSFTPRLADRNVAMPAVFLAVHGAVHVLELDRTWNVSLRFAGTLPPLTLSHRAVLYRDEAAREVRVAVAIETRVHVLAVAAM